jgi:murein L,D-transpeptidase YafK
MQFWTILVLIATVLVSGYAIADEVDLVQVNKAERNLLLLAKGQVIKRFSIALGGKPKGHKQQEGDKRTPEGRYTLDYKKMDSAYFRAIHISYPNEQDILSAKMRGVEPGRNIMIHGQKNGFGWLSMITQLFDWTNGCIALANNDMEQVLALVKPGTSIEIHP